MIEVVCEAWTLVYGRRVECELPAGHGGEDHHGPGEQWSERWNGRESAHRGSRAENPKLFAELDRNDVECGYWDQVRARERARAR